MFRLSCAGAVFIAMALTSSADVLPEVNTNTVAKLAVLQEKLDAGANAEALTIGRSLLSVQDKKTQMRLADAFGWIGKSAIPELVELMGKSDEEVANYAFHNWEVAFAEIENDSRKITVITNSATHITNKALIDGMLLHLDECSERDSILAVQGLIEQTRGQVCCACAKEMFEHLAGEAWLSRKRTEKILKIR